MTSFLQRLLRRRRLSHRALCLVLAVLVVVGPAPLAAQQPTAGAAGTAAPAKTDLSYVVPGACAIVAVRPAQILAAPGARMLPVEVLQAAAVQHLGLDPLAMEQVVASAAPPAGGPPSYAVAARSRGTAALPQGPLVGHTQPGTFNGTTYLQNGETDNPLAPSFMLAGANTLLVAPDFALPKLLTPETSGPTGLLAAAFAASDQGDDLHVLVDLEPLRPFIAMALNSSPTPPELAELKTLPQLVKSIELRATVSRQATSELVVEANSEAHAQQILTVLDGVKQRAAADAEVEIRRLLASEDPVEQAMGGYLTRMNQELEARTQIVREDARLIVFRTDGTQDNTLTHVAVIGVLIGLLLPAVQAARAAARRNVSINNLKELVLGMLNYESAMKRFPAYARHSPEGLPLLSWRVELLPYMEEAALYREFRLDEPWDSEHNKALIPRMPAVFRDPSSGHAQQEGLTNYLGVKGAGCLFDGTHEGRTIRAITDGSSNTVAIVQVNDEAAAIWTKPEDWEADSAAGLESIAGLHTNVVLAAFCDGHIASLSSEVDPAALKAMTTVAGDEAVSLGR